MNAPSAMRTKEPRAAGLFMIITPKILTRQFPPEELAPCESLLRLDVSFAEPAAGCWGKGSLWRCSGGLGAPWFSAIKACFYLYALLGAPKSAQSLSLQLFCLWLLEQ